MSRDCAGLPASAPVNPSADEGGLLLMHGVAAGRWPTSAGEAATAAAAAADAAVAAAVAAGATAAEAAYAAATMAADAAASGTPASPGSSSGDEDEFQLQHGAGGFRFHRASRLDPGPSSSPATAPGVVGDPMPRVSMDAAQDPVDGYVYGYSQDPVDRYVYGYGQDPVDGYVYSYGQEVEEYYGEEYYYLAYDPVYSQEQEEYDAAYDPSHRYSQGQDDDAAYDLLYRYSLGEEEYGAEQPGSYAALYGSYGEDGHVAYQKWDGYADEYSEVYQPADSQRYTGLYSDLVPGLYADFYGGLRGDSYGDDYYGAHQHNQQQQAGSYGQGDIAYQQEAGSAHVLLLDDSYGEDYRAYQPSPSPTQSAAQGDDDAPLGPAFTPCPLAKHPATPLTANTPVAAAAVVAASSPATASSMLLPTPQATAATADDQAGLTGPAAAAAASADDWPGLGYDDLVLVRLVDYAADCLGALWEGEGVSHAG